MQDSRCEGALRDARALRDALGEDVGAKTLDLEWVQLHPTGPGPQPTFTTGPSKAALSCESLL